MSDPTNDSADATPTDSAPGGDMPEPAQPTEGAAPADTGPPPRHPWYWRRWAVIVGAAAAAAILFLGGMAVGTAIGDQGRGDYGRDVHRYGAGGQGYGHQGWGDNGMPPEMGQGGQGYGWDHDGNRCDRGGGHWGHQGDERQPTPGTSPTPSASASPQAYLQ